MHVAHFIQRYSPALGGSEAYFGRLSRWRRDQGDEVTVWTSTAIDLSAFWSSTGRQLRPGTTFEDGITIRRYQPSHWFARRHFLRLLSYLPSAPVQCLTMTCNPVALRMMYDAAAFEGPCDLVHASALPYGWPLYCALTLARRKQVPFFFTPFLHLGNTDDPSDRTRRIYTSKPMRYLMHAADMLFVQTRTEAEAIRMLGVPDERITLQGLGVDADECTGGDRATARQRWNISNSDCVIGHLANLSPPKGTIDLLRAARTAWTNGAKFRVVLAGPEMPEFRRFWQSFEPKQRVVKLGVISDCQKRDFLAGIDGFCLPSRSDSFGLVLLEAWANGKPTIGYRTGAIGELIQHGDDGLLARCGDIESLADKLTQIERDPHRAQAMGEVGRKRTEWEFRWEDKLRVVDGMIEMTFDRAGSTTQRY